jgi:hypothetical protein
MIGSLENMSSSPYTSSRTRSLKEMAASYKKCTPSIISRLRKTPTVLSCSPLTVPLRKAQFELHFRNWGFRKNQTKEMWAATASCVAKRKRDGKETEVWKGCERISTKRSKKELARYGYGADFLYGSQGD